MTRGNGRGHVIGGDLPQRIPFPRSCELQRGGQTLRPVPLPPPESSSFFPPRLIATRHFAHRVRGDSKPGPRAPLVQPLRRAGPGRAERARSSAGGAAWARAMCPPEIFSNLVRRLPGGLLKAAAKDELKGGERCACPFSVGMSRSSVSNVASSSAAHLRRPEQHRPAFSEDQFLAVSKELVSTSGRPDTSWQLLTNVQGLCIYRLYDEVRGVAPGSPRVRCPGETGGRERGPY